MLVIFNGAQARSIRKEKGVHLSALAESADATERFLSDLEHGKKRKPSAAYLYRISQALGVSMEMLMQEIPDGDEQQDRLLLVTKWLYPKVARHFQMD